MSAGRTTNATTVPQPVRAVSWAPDGTWVAVAAAQPGAWVGDYSTVGVLTVLTAEPGPPGWSVTNSGPVNDVAVSPDGQWIAVGGARTGVASAQNGSLRYGYEGFWGEAAAYSPDGKVAAWRGWQVHAGLAQMVMISDVTRPDSPTPWRWESEGAVVFSPDSRLVVAPGTHGVGLFSVDSGVDVLPVAGGVRNVAVSPDGTWIAAACGDGTIRLFKVTGEPGPVIRPGGDLRVLSVAFSPDSVWVAGIVEPGVGVYRVSDGGPRWPRLADVPEAGKVVFSPDLRRLAVNQTVGNPSIAGLVVLDCATGAALWQATTSDRVMDVAFSPDGTRLAACGANADLTGFVRIYDSGLEASRSRADGAITALSMSPAGTPLVAAASSTGVSVLVADTGAPVARKPVPGGVSGLAFADHSQSVVVGGPGGVRLFSVVGDRSWKLDTIGVVNALAVGGPAGQSIATASGKTARVLRSIDGSAVWNAPVGHPQTVTRIAISADGRWVATGCVDRKTRLLDGGAEVLSVEGDGKVFSLAFGGGLLATANEDGAVVLVDPVAAAVRARITRNFACSQVAFNSGGLVAAAWDDKVVTVHDLSGGQPVEVRRLTYGTPVAALAFSPVGAVLCVAADVLMVVDPLTGLDVARLPHPKPVRQVAFSSDGSLLTTACEDDHVRVFAT